MTRRDPRRPVSGESGLVQRVRARLRAAPVAPPLSVVVGFSGGPDSLALLAVLATLARRGHAMVTAVHVDHGLRPGSAAEQRLVAEQVTALGVPFRGVRLAPGVQDRHPGVGLEEAARRERFFALRTVAGDVDAGIIALGHHRDDQAETVLLHLFRGAGLRGAAGMREWTERPVPWWTAEEAAPRIRIWRPLLEESKDTLQAHLAGLGLQRIDDPSNDTDDFARNRIRRHVLPSISGVFPAAVDAIGRFAAVAGDDDDLLDVIAGDALPRLVVAGGGLDVRLLLNEHRALRRRLIRLWLTDQPLRNAEIPQERIEAVLRLAVVGAGGRSIQIGAHWGVALDAGRLVCTRRHAVET